MARTQMVFTAVPTRGVIQSTTQAWPRADMVQTQKALHITIELPGVEREQLTARFEPGQLIVEGQHKRPPLHEPARVLQVEIAYGPFYRAFPLPEEADGANIEATYQDGVLSVVVPLVPRTVPPSRRVQIS